MSVTLYGLPGSHPTLCAERALQLKEIEYRRQDLVPVAHKPIQRLRFGAPTVPAIELDGERVVGSRRILRRLDDLKGSPRLYPAKAEARTAVEGAEEWGDEVLQEAARRIVYACVRRSPSSALSYSEGSTLPLPGWMVQRSGPIVARVGAWVNGATDSELREQLAQLPGHLDKVDSWIEEGVMGGRRPNASDLQIGASIRLLQTVEDLRPLLEGRPGAELAQRVYPEFAGRVSAGAIPADWLPARAAR